MHICLPRLFRRKNITGNIECTSWFKAKTQLLTIGWLKQAESLSQIISATGTWSHKVLNESERQRNFWSNCSKYIQMETAFLEETYKRRLLLWHLCHIICINRRLKSRGTRVDTSTEKKKRQLTVGGLWREGLCESSRRLGARRSRSFKPRVSRSSQWWSWELWPGVTSSRWLTRCSRRRQESFAGGGPRLSSPVHSAGCKAACLSPFFLSAKLQL